MYELTTITTSLTPSFIFCYYPRQHSYHDYSLETVVYLNLRVGRESLNHQVLSADLNTEGGGSRPMPAFQGGGIHSHDPVASPMDYY